MHSSSDQLRAERQGVVVSGGELLGKTLRDPIQPYEAIRLKKERKDRSCPRAEKRFEEFKP